MTRENLDIEATFSELRKSSQISLTMVVLGALALMASLIYSGTRLAPLEEEIHQKSARIKELSLSEQEYLKRIEAAKVEYEQLKANTEKLYAVRVTPKNLVYELKAAAKATGRMTSGGPGYNFSIYINSPKSTLNTIRKVTYLFDHPTFIHKTQISDSVDNNFKVSYFGWGCLTNVRATLDFKDGETQAIDFNMCQSLGPQW